ncbi:MAG: nucleotidyltransferase domain-containing protein [Cyanothece sp. SIO1E1]|nr:nucleotidyltransferase domain-containing protein [Cyanothece sp. SIO1E1]
MIGKTLTGSNPSLEQRRQQALAIAEQCIHLLKQDLGATDVILFGSLRGDAPWHWRSDLDLAVVGMSETAIWQAYGMLEKIVPSWLKFDLVALEQVPPEVRTRILQEKPMPDNHYLALKARIEDEMIALERNVERLTALLAQAETVPEIALTPALASYVADFYTGCERISERVAIMLDGSLPQGEHWHQGLLLQVADPDRNNRPLLWPNSLLLRLDEYRKFRHLARHRYNVELEVAKVLVLAQTVPPVWADVQQAITIFAQWLEQQGH